MKTLIVATGLSALTSTVLAGLPVGRGEIFVSATGTITYDSNLYGTDEATGDTSATLAPRISYARRAALLETEANLGVSIIRYSEETELDSENLDVNAALRFPSTAGRNYSGSLFAAYLETSNLDTDLNARVNTDTTTLEARSALLTGPRGEVSVQGRHTDTTRSLASDQQSLATEVAYRYRDFFYENNLRLATNYDQLSSSGDNARGAALDQTSYTFTVGLDRAFANEALRVGINYGYRVLERSAAETAEGETSQGGSIFSVSLDGPFLPKKHFPKIESRFGLTYQEAASPGIDDTGSRELTGFLNLDWQARERTRVSFSANRSQRLSADDLSVVSTRVRLGLDQTLRPSLIASASAGYDWSSYSTVNREDRTSTLSAGLRYTFARVWDASLNYTFSSTASDVRASDYDRHLVSASITYRF